MLFLIHYSDTINSRIETYAILTQNNHKYTLLYENTSMPYEIIDALFETINFLLSRSGFIIRTSIFFGFDNSVDPYYRINDHNDLINNLPSLIKEKEVNSDFYEKLKNTRKRFLKINFYKKKIKKNFNELIEENSFLLKDSFVKNDGLIIEINIYEGTKIISLFYKESIRKALLNYDVKRLFFIGRTSMKVDNCILMSNLTNIKDNQIVYDPFCGSGSLLNIPAYFGALVVGCDIKKMEFFGTNEFNGKIRTNLKGFNVFTNFDKFNTKHKVLGFLTCDIKKSPISYADVILADIPYGIRISSLDYYIYIDYLFDLGTNILPSKGYLAFYAPTSEDIKKEKFILKYKVEEKTRMTVRSLYVFMKE